MSKPYQLFKTAGGEKDYLAAYDAMLAKWPTPYESMFVPTRFGETHVLASGAPENPPLILLHAAGTTATMWYRNVGGLSEKLRVYAIDSIVDGRSQPTSALPTRQDCADWLLDVLDGLEIERANIAGLSHGGWYTVNFALFYPQRVNRLILLSPAASVESFKPRFYLDFALIQVLGYIKASKEAGRAMAQWFFAEGNEIDETLLELIEMAAKHIKPPKMYFPRKFSDEELRSLGNPTLLLIGAEGRIYDPQRAMRRAQALIPNLESGFVAHGGHVFPIEQPDVVNQKVVEFILNQAINP